MNTTHEVLEIMMEVSDIFASLDNDLAAEFEATYEKAVTGQLTDLQFANEFNSLRVSAVCDFNGGEFADFLLEVEEAFERGYFLP